MPRLSFSTDCLLEGSCRSFNRRDQRPSLITEITANEQSTILSPNQINEILSRKLYNQLETISELEKEQNFKQKTESFANPLLRPLFNNSLTSNVIDSELILLINRFFNLTYLNTIPMVNLLATAVATNFLEESIRELDKKLQEEQQTYSLFSVKRRISLLHPSDDDDDDDDEALSWTSAPT